MQNIGNVSELPGGVYPGESIWSIVNRFIWLNRTNLNETSTFLRELVEIDSPFRKSTTPYLTLSKGALPSVVVKNRSLNRRKMKIASPPKCARYSFSFIRYCPECAKHGYHASVFQVPTLERCPAHGVLLTSKCPSCGRSIRGDITTDTVNYPYACGACGASLVESRRKFFQADRPPGIHRIVSAERWLYRLDQLTIAWGCFPSLGWRGIDRSAVDSQKLMAALVAATGLRRVSWLKWPTNELTNCTTLAFNPMVRISESFDADRKMTTFSNLEAIYKAFLRRKAVQLRAILSKHGGLSKARLTPAKEAFLVFPDLMELAFSMLFFRAHCEGWRSGKEFENSLEVACFRRIHGKVAYVKQSLWPNPGAHFGRLYKPYLENNRMPEVVRSWAEGHLFMQQLLWIWAEASAYASEMVRKRRILRRPLLLGIFMPHFFTLTRNQESSVYRLDFWLERENSVRPDFASAWYAAEGEREARSWADAIAALDRM